MKAEDFRKLALSLPNAGERVQMEHPEFHVDGRVFASLGYPDDAWAMVQLYPAQQSGFMADFPGVFIPANGALGVSGCTNIFLEGAQKEVAAQALHAAWRNVSVRMTLSRLEDEEEDAEAEPSTPPSKPVRKGKSISAAALRAREP